MSDDFMVRYADLLKRRADVYSPRREREPYYGDDDIDLLRAMIEAAVNERDALREALREAEQSFMAIRKLLLPILRGEDRDVVDIAETVDPALARIRDILGGENG